jgi:hypothetical protein
MDPNRWSLSMRVWFQDGGVAVRFSLFLLRYMYLTLFVQVANAEGSTIHNDADDSHVHHQDLRQEGSNSNIQYDHSRSVVLSLRLLAAVTMASLLVLERVGKISVQLRNNVTTAIPAVHSLRMINAINTVTG